MDLTVKNLVLSYETLANQAVNINQSYLSLLKLYDELNFAPDLLQELEKAGNSPLTVIEAMQRDEQAIVEKFTHLASFIANAQVHFTSNPEAEQLKAVAHDCQVMQDFISSIDLGNLQQMFVQLRNL